MSDHHIPKQPLYGELWQDKRTVGGQRKFLKDSLKILLKGFHINSGSCQKQASDRCSWCQLITIGANTEEERRFLQAERKWKCKRPESTPSIPIFVPPAEEDSSAIFKPISCIRAHQLGWHHITLDNEGQTTLQELIGNFWAIALYVSSKESCFMPNAGLWMKFHIRLVFVPWCINSKITSPKM